MTISSTSADLTGRDASIVRLVAQFKQASSRQVHELLFTDISYTPADRALKRLTDRGYLTRIERRTVGGSRGGSGQYVYSLGRRGYFLHFDGGGFRPGRTVDYHALAVLDGHISMVRRSKDGAFTINGYSVEDECWLKVAGDDIRPDYLIDLTRPNGKRWRMWFEIDMGSEGQKQIRAKLARYVRADRELDEELPLILWVAVDDERAKELKWIISSLTPEAQRLFRVTTLAGLSTIFAA